MWWWRTERSRCERVRERQLVAAANAAMLLKTLIHTHTTKTHFYTTHAIMITITTSAHSLTDCLHCFYSLLLPNHVTPFSLAYELPWCSLWIFIHRLQSHLTRLMCRWYVPNQIIFALLLPSSECILNMSVVVYALALQSFTHRRENHYWTNYFWHFPPDDIILDHSSTFFLESTVCTDRQRWVANAEDGRKGKRASLQRLIDTATYFN